MGLLKLKLWLTLTASVGSFDLFEIPMNMAGFMSIERASDACEDRINEAVKLFTSHHVMSFEW